MDKKDAYNELLKDPRWQKRRLEIFERDNWTSQICGTKDKMLHVHHIAYIKNRKPWDYPDNLLITLCEDCHEQEHNLYSWILSEIDSMRNEGVLLGEIYEVLNSTHFRMRWNQFRIKEVCDGMLPNGKPYPCADILERLAKRRITLKGENI